ncbi:hypothetical protein FDW83_11510 [Pseudarthrobacter sp. NamE2]|uniref:hypothetical protein n=1 Tax=Pseudarthrobacter sp. NamE2 TaxID=2576838 RepID=UPI0010FD6C10|nr:hypothetical protein [Pseudarthrobacter sp. NamE2]TLM83011.1 hypothetical protein FDW83_11510 [Pseudarthrobacter sp. NamE2]
MTKSGKLFFDPLSPGLEPALKQERVSGHPVSGMSSNGTQTAAELKALRAASLAQVSRDLERMLRERAR